uniref:Uncharacterized protein n=1 Tax=Anguilla anguilla TaxID=7936 RepID=A0A0E9XY57_ANGAN
MIDRPCPVTIATPMIRALFGRLNFHKLASLVVYQISIDR